MGFTPKNNNNGGYS